MTTESGKARRPATLRDLRTSLTARIRSKPANEGQEYLDLWTLKRERARWSQTKERAEQMIQTIDKDLKRVNLPEAAAAADAPDEPRAATTIDFNFKAAGRRRRA